MNYRKGEGAMGKLMDEERREEYYDEELYRIKAEMFKALAHPIRLKIMELLLKGERSVGDIVKKIGSEPPNISRHLSILKRAGLVFDVKKGQNVYYSAKNPCVDEITTCIRSFLKAKVEAQQKLLENL